jgi:transcriptional regulator GlxA family with amidase domain
LAERLRSSPETYESEFAATMAEKNLMTRLLLGGRHNYRVRLEQEPHRAPTTLVRKLVDLIHAHPEWDHSVESLAREAQVSARTVERAFQRDKATTPMAYLKMVRLDRAYDDLHAAAPDMVQVAEVARRWGFVNRGRFAADYRQRHGEPPSMTLRR